MKNIIFLSIVLMAVLSKAAGQEAGHHDEGGIPLDKIGWQAANLGLLLVAIIYFIRKSIFDAFAGRQKDFLEQSEKTKAALKNAEHALADIRSKLNSLESGEKNSLENAKKEAQIQKNNFINETNAAVEKMKNDAQLMMANELLRAQSEIVQTVVDQAVNSTKQKLKANRNNLSVSGLAQEAEFIKQLSQVQA